MFNAFNHANFALPSEVEAGVPGGSIPARFGTLESTISPPTGILGVGLGGDSSPRMIAFQGRIVFQAGDRIILIGETRNERSLFDCQCSFLLCTVMYHAERSLAAGRHSPVDVG